MSRGRSVIRDPAVAIAASKCWLASMGGALPGIPPIDSFHPAECTYCEFDRDGIVEAVAEFVEWSGISSDEENPLRLEIESFLTLPSTEQSRLVRQAQGMADG